MGSVTVAWEDVISVIHLISTHLDLVTSNFDNVIVIYNGANSMEMG